MEPKIYDTPKPHASENFSLSLEALRTLHAAASTRWANRRDYEWKLSYAIWTALAGFIATVVLAKDSAFVPFQIDWHRLPTWILAIFLTLPTALHLYYLWGMVARTLNDLDLFDEVEHAIRKIDPWVAAHISTRFFNSDFIARTRLSRRYGLVAQVGITFLLSVTAFWFVSRSRPETKKDVEKNMMNCQPFVAIPANPLAMGPAVALSPENDLHSLRRRRRAHSHVKRACRRPRV